jgi:hypothetical protein
MTQQWGLWALQETTQALSGRSPSKKQNEDCNQLGDNLTWLTTTSLVQFMTVLCHHPEFFNYHLVRSQAPDQGPTCTTPAPSGWPHWWLHFSFCLSRRMSCASQDPGCPSPTWSCQCPSNIQCYFEGCLISLTTLSTQPEIIDTMSKNVCLPLCSYSLVMNNKCFLMVVDLFRKLWQTLKSSNIKYNSHIWN